MNIRLEGRDTLAEKEVKQLNAFREPSSPKKAVVTESAMPGQLP